MSSAIPQLALRHLQYLSSYSFAPHTITTHFFHDLQDNVDLFCDVCGLKPSDNIATTDPLCVNPSMDANEMNMGTIQPLKPTCKSPVTGSPAAYTLSLVCGEVLSFYGAVDMFIHSGEVMINGYRAYAQNNEKTLHKNSANAPQTPDDAPFPRPIPYLCPPVSIDPSQLIIVNNPSWNSTATFSIHALVDSRITLFPSRTPLDLIGHPLTFANNPYNHPELSKGTDLTPICREEAIAEASFLYHQLTEIYKVLEATNSIVCDALPGVIHENEQMSANLNNTAKITANNQFLITKSSLLYVLNDLLFKIFSTLPILPQDLPLCVQSTSPSSSPFIIDPQHLAIAHIKSRYSQLEHFQQSPLRCFALPGFHPLLISRAFDQYGKPRDFTTQSIGYKWRFAAEFMCKQYLHTFDMFLRFSLFLQTQPLSPTHLPHAIVLNTLSIKPYTMMVIGARNHGKSTLSRYLINHFLSELPYIALLETDIGQTECTPCGNVSITIHQRPLLSPVFCENIWVPKFTAFYGHNSPDENPQSYLHAVNTVYTEFIQYLSVRQKQLFNQSIHASNTHTHQHISYMPLLVNTAGWTTGMGKTLLSHIAYITRPEVIVEINDKLIPPASTAFTMDTPTVLLPTSMPTQTPGIIDDKPSTFPHTLPPSPQLPLFSHQYADDDIIRTYYSKKLPNKTQYNVPSTLDELLTQIHILSQHNTDQHIPQYSVEKFILEAQIANLVFPEWLLHVEYNQTPQTLVIPSYLSGFSHNTGIVGQCDRNNTILSLNSSTVSSTTQSTTTPSTSCSLTHTNIHTLLHTTSQGMLSSNDTSGIPANIHSSSQINQSDYLPHAITFPRPAPPYRLGASVLSSYLPLYNTFFDIVQFIQLFSCAVLKNDNQPRSNGTDSLLDQIHAIPIRSENPYVVILPRWYSDNVPLNKYVLYNNITTTISSPQTHNSAGIQLHTNIFNVSCTFDSQQYLKNIATVKFPLLAFSQISTNPLTNHATSGFSVISATSNIGYFQISNMLRNILQHHPQPLQLFEMTPTSTNQITLLQKPLTRINSIGLSNNEVRALSLLLYFFGDIYFHYEFSNDSHYMQIPDKTSDYDVFTSKLRPLYQISSTFTHLESPFSSPFLTSHRLSLERAGTSFNRYLPTYTISTSSITMCEVNNVCHLLHNTANNGKTTPSNNPYLKQIDTKILSLLDCTIVGIGSYRPTNGSNEAQFIALGLGVVRGHTITTIPHSTITDIKSSFNVSVYITTPLPPSVIDECNVIVKLHPVLSTLPTTILFNPSTPHLQPYCTPNIPTQGSVDDINGDTVDTDGQHSDISTTQMSAIGKNMMKSRGNIIRSSTKSKK